MFIVSLLMTFGITVAATLLLRPVAVRLGLVDVPGGRKLHQGSVPLIGGIAMFMGISFGLLMVGHSLLSYRGLLAAMGVLVFIGVLDDFHELSPKVKVCGQIFAAILVALFGHVLLSDFGNLFGLGDVHFGLLVLPITIFAIVGMINAVNFIDGVDGLAATVIASQLLALLLVCVTTGFLGDAAILAVVLASVAGFLCFNFPCGQYGARKVFMGDAGSMLLGVVLVWFLIKLTQSPRAVIEPMAAVWVVAYQLMDVVSCIARRLRARQSPFHPDKLHLHHILQRIGLSPLAVVLTIVAGNTLMAAKGLLLDLLWTPRAKNK